MKPATLLLLIVLVTSACTARLDPSDPLAPVEGYLVENIGEENFGGRSFCAYDVLDMGVRFDGAEVYVWALCGEYYLNNGALTLGTASSLPVALSMEVTPKGYAITRHDIPGDGTEYGPSIRRIFPPTAIEAMCEGETACYNERANRLEEEIEEKAREYYGIEQDQ